MSRRHHVVVFSRWYPSPESPVAGVFVRDQVDALRPVCDVTVIVPRSGSVREVLRFLAGRKPLSSEEYVPVPDWRALGSLGRWLVFDRTLARLSRPADVVHLHLLLPDGLPLLLAAKRRRIPLVVTEHANYLSELLESARARVQLTRVLRGATAVLAASTRLAEQLRSLEPTVEPVVVGVPIDMSLFYPSEDAPLDYAVAVAVLLGEPKGTDVLLRAWANASSRATPPRLVLVGAETEPFERLARELGIEDACTFVGAREHAEVASLMRGASFLVSASRDENFAGVVAEAIAAGTPVVSTRVGEPAHYVSASVGLLVEPGDVEGLADAIVEMADRASTFDPNVLHRHIADLYGFDTARTVLLRIYERVTRAASAA